MRQSSITRTCLRWTPATMTPITRYWQWWASSCLIGLVMCKASANRSRRDSCRLSRSCRRYGREWMRTSDLRWSGWRELTLLACWTSLLNPCSLKESPQSFNHLKSSTKTKQKSLKSKTFFLIFWQRWTSKERCTRQMTKSRIPRSTSGSSTSSPTTTRSSATTKTPSNTAIAPLNTRRLWLICTHWKVKSCSRLVIGSKRRDCLRRHVVWIRLIGRWMRSRPAKQSNPAK